MHCYPDILLLEQNGDLTGALRSYRNLYMKNPADEAAVYGIAQCALALGNLEHALEFFVKLLILNHGCAQAYIGRANVLFQYDERRRAMSDLARAIELDTPASLLRIDCAAVLNDNGLTAFAMKALTPIRNMAIEDRDFQCEWVFCLMAERRIDHPDVKRILDEFAKDSDQDPYYSFCIHAYRALEGDEASALCLTATANENPELLERAAILGFDAASPDWDDRAQ